MQSVNRSPKMSFNEGAHCAIGSKSLSSFLARIFIRHNFTIQSPTLYLPPIAEVRWQHVAIAAFSNGLVGTPFCRQ
jgi:hypothetical protein